MQKQPLGCITATGILTALVTALVIAGIWLTQGGGIFSPGLLSDQRGPTSLGGVYTHAETEDKCAACHTAPWEKETSSDRCMDCHANLAQSENNFMVMMVAQTRHTPCIDCHTEHKGRDGELSKMDLTDFDHLLSGFKLQSHIETSSGTVFTCYECHTPQFTSFDQGVCLECHTQADAAFTQDHTGLYGADCTACHDGVETYGKDFDHSSLQFPLEGKHSEAECQACHENARQRMDLYNTPQECIQCHVEDDGHQGEHGSQCSFCHNAGFWEGASLYHHESRFPLVGAHRQVTCEQCHPEGVFENTPLSCIGCHQEQNEHNGRFGETCSTCHAPTRWENTHFDHVLSASAHGGMYSNAECRNCHGPAFKTTPNTCEECHAEPAIHAGMFDEKCKVCHTPDGWVPAKYDGEHSFPMEHGAETANTCETCHPFKIGEYTCYGCHEHNRLEIETKYQEKGVEDFENCTRCHPQGTVTPGLQYSGEIDAATDTGSD